MKKILFVVALLAATMTVNAQGLLMPQPFTISVVQRLI